MKRGLLIQTFARKPPKFERNDKPGGTIGPGVLAFLLVIGNAEAADATWIGPVSGSQLWFNNANWVGGVPGQTNDAASINTDVARITNGASVNLVQQIDFSLSLANGHLALGAIVASRTTGSSLFFETVQPVSSGGTLTLNGASIGGIPNTILANIANGSDGGLIVGNATRQFDAVRLGNTSNVVQVSYGRFVYVGSIITERTAGSGITLTRDLSVGDYLLSGQVGEGSTLLILHY